MDKSKSLSRLLNMVLKKKYPHVANVEVTYALKKLGRVGKREVLDHMYRIYVLFNKEESESTTNLKTIQTDIGELTRMVLTEPNEHHYNIFNSIDD